MNERVNERVMPGRPSPPMPKKFVAIPPPEEGEHMVIRAFADSVKSGCLIQDDGCAIFATAQQMSDVVWDWQSRFPTWASHVVWFNK